MAALSTATVVTAFSAKHTLVAAAACKANAATSGACDSSVTAHWCNYMGCTHPCTAQWPPSAQASQARHTVGQASWKCVCVCGVCVCVRVCVCVCAASLIALSTFNYCFHQVVVFVAVNRM